MKAVVRVVFEVTVDTDNQKDYNNINPTDPPYLIAEKMVKFDVENFPEAEMPTKVKFKEWVK